MTTTRGRAVVAPVLALVLALVACAPAAGDGGRSGREATAPDLLGHWVLLEGTAGGSSMALPPGSRATLEFGGGARAGGTSFCNGFGGRYRLDGGRLELEDVAVSLAMCEGPVGAAEGAYLDVLLGGGLEAAVDGSALVLTGSSGTLRFARLPPAPLADLVGVRWVLESWERDGSVFPAGGEPAVLELREDGTVTVSTGCQTMAGTWRASGDSVHVADHVYDPEACPPGLADQDSVVTVTTSGGFQASVAGDVLTVTDADTRGAAGAVLRYRAG